MPDYVDSSAFLKLVLEEPESEAIENELGPDRSLISSALLRVEAQRAAARRGGDALRRAGEALAGVALVALDGPILEAAARLDPPELRSLDALHLATALSLAPDLGRFLCYDHRLAEAATAAGLTVSAPA